jgi:hypothetical protein
MRPYLHTLAVFLHSTLAVKTKILVAVCSVACLFGTSQVMAQNPSLVSVNKDGTASGNGPSEVSYRSVSADGRYVAFVSKANDLTASDGNANYDLFVRDRTTGTTTLVSVNAAGTGGGNGNSGTTGPVDFTVPTYYLSSNGRIIAFTSAASDLVPNDTNNRQDVFVRDLDAGVTVLVSVNLAGTASGNGTSTFPYLSADGSIVGFRSSSNNLVANDTNGFTDVFVRNWKTGITTLVSVNSAGTASGNGQSLFSTFSADGQFVAFQSGASDLVANDSNGTVFDDVFVRDLQTGTTTLVSVAANGVGSGNGDSTTPIISADGHAIAFDSLASNLVTVNDANNDVDVFVRNLVTATTSLVSVNQTGTGAGSSFSFIPSPSVISANGNLIAFVSSSPNLVANDTNQGSTDVFVRDVAAGTTTLISINSAGTGSGNADSVVGGVQLEISPDGRFVVFDSFASDLVASGSGPKQNIFVRDRQQAKTILASSNASHTSGGNNHSRVGSISADGSTVIFESDATDLVTNDTNGVVDVFAFTLPQAAGNGTLQFDAATYSTSEGQATATVTVTRTGGTSGAVSATVSTAGGGTASAGQDYTAVSQVVTFADGETASKTVSLPITDDALVEGSETVNLSLGSPTGGAVLGSPAAAVLTIADNDTCSYSITPSNRAALPAGETFTVNVTAQSGCAWTAVSNSNFINVTAGASGSGNGTVTIVVLSNGSGVPRVGTVTIAGQTLTVTQSELIPDVLTLGFTQSNYAFSEGAGRATLTIARTGETSGAASADYRTSDTDTFSVGCADTVNNNGGAFGRCDFAITVGRIDFAPGESQKTLTVPLIDDGHDENSETFQVVLSNLTGASSASPNLTTTVTIQDNDAAGAPNPVLTSIPFFVRQHYLDFLSREPEPNEPWSAVLGRCADIFTGPATNTDCDRIAVSRAFFESPEFNLKGIYVFRFYKLAFNRLPQYTEIVSDMSFVAGATAEEVFARKAQLATAFVARQEFTNAYGAMSNAQFVAALLGRYQLTQIVTPDPAQPDGTAKVTLTNTDLTNRLNANTLTRAQVFRAIADSDQVQAFEFERAFIAVQYYGYLRRTPEPAGYEANLNALQRGTSRREMINGFLNSAEYKLRFGNLPQ